MRNKLLLALCFTLFSIPTISFSQNISDYLVLQDIGQYKMSIPEKLIPGFAPVGGPRTYDSSGIIAATGHFSKDHVDKTYKIMYLGGEGLPSPTVEVTQHAGSDSDKWLLHEVEDGYRKSKDLNATYVSSNPLKEINGNRIWYTWGYYRWVSNNVVVSIEFTDLTGTKPEPLEVVQAYLAKFPSTIPATLVLDQAHNEQWIKDEMDRRLWLGDKWIARIETVGDLNELSSVVKSLNVFLDYREKYYGIEAATEKQTLSEYQQAKNKAGIKTKLEEYKTWWAENKDKPITL